MLFLLYATTTATAQQVNWDKIKAADADKILLAGSRQPTKVLLLGTFHFAYPNLDAHKTDSAHYIDVLSPARQQEMKELADVISRFKPTKVYIESTKQSYHDSLYAAYKQGTYEAGRNEIFQLGYRVAGMMNLDKVYCVDAGNYLSENYKKNPELEKMSGERGLDTLRDKYWWQRYEQVYTAGDSLDKNFTLLESFLLMAEPITQRRMHGAYLTTGFNTAGNSGPDMLSMWWYSRNLRIFNNILTTKPAGEDRILVLFGNGHAPILRHCFEASPEFELVALKSLLR